MPRDSLGRSGPKKQLSCESCRKRKIRCERPGEENGQKVISEENHPSGSGHRTLALEEATKLARERNLPTCMPCRDLRVECVTLYDRKRRGPPSSIARRFPSVVNSSPDRARRHPNPATPSTKASVDGATDDHLLPFHLTTPPTGNAPARSHSPTTHSTHRNHSPGTKHLWDRDMLPPPFPPMRDSGTHAGSTSAGHSQALISVDPSPALTRNLSTSMVPSGVSAQVNSSMWDGGPIIVDGGPLPPPPQQQQQQQQQQPHSHPYPRYEAHRLVLEEILPRETAVYIISLYFDYVHCLIPCIHRPTFLERLGRRDDSHDPHFYALVMSVLAASLVHIPKALLPINDEPPISLAGRCIRASRLVSVDLYDPPSLDIITIRYFDSAFYSLTGKKGAWISALSEVRGLVIHLQMHRESSYAGLGPLDSEMRRRMFITAFMADKSSACMQNQLITLRGEDCDTAYFQDIDDEYITQTQYLPQPEGTTSKMAGHRLISQIFTIVGEIVEIRRSVSKQRDTNNPAAVLARLRHLENLNRQLTGIFSDLPAPLRLTLPASPVSFDMQSSASQPWEMQALTDLNAYFSSLMDHNTQPITNEAFLIMQGNIHVTRAIARLTLITAREETVACSGPIGSAGRSAAERVLSYSYLAHDRRDTVVSDLLYALKKIPVQNLAVNSHSLINKIRFVAVTLLDSVLGADTTTIVEGSSAQMNQEALMSFLGILSEIEQRLVNDHHST